MYIYINENVKIFKDYTGALIIKKSSRNLSSYKVNPSGAEIFLLCNGMNTVNDIVDCVADKYNVKDQEEKSQIYSDVRGFLNEYIQKGILNVSENKMEMKINEIGNENLIVPPKLSLELTNKCQLSCKHCFNLSGIERMNEIDIDKFIEISKKFVELGTQGIFITGGEASLKPGIEKLITFAGNNFSDVSIASNGYYLKDELVKLIGSFPNIRIQISIDGSENTHDKIRGKVGAFRNSVSSIKKLIKYNIPVTIAFTMNFENMNELDYVVNMAKELGCRGVNISATSDTGRAKENNLGKHIDNFSEIIEKTGQTYMTEDFGISVELCEDDIKKIEDDIECANKCGAGYNVVHIYSNGEISLCPCIRSINLGNVDDDIEKILNHKNIERAMNIPTPNREICGDCSSYESCGRCIANMLNKSEEECVVKRGLNI